jgi:rhodanese-related sulfurtransferase/mRNA-degrading endonuclease RelE of RelBE toxin-antitoxin system
MSGNSAAQALPDGLLDQVLASKAFARVPRDNLKRLVSRIEMLPVRAGETIIRQGEVGDSFYIVRTGKFRVIGYMSVEDDTVEIASLGPGDSFGEEALIRNAPRNATIEALTDGSVARLDKEGFVEFVQNALLHGAEPETAKTMIGEGAVVVDVRPSVEYNTYSIRGSRGVPLDLLRRARRNFDPNKTYITCSDNELESALAAFLIAQQGFDASYLKGSIADYLRLTRQYGENSVMLPDGADDLVIDLPEEYEAPRARPVMVEDPEHLDAASASVAAATRGVVASGSDVEQLRLEFRQALDAQGVELRQEIKALKELLTKNMESNSKILIKEFLTRIATLEHRIPGAGGS